MTEETIKIDFPLDIGIVGAPGSGKEELIREFAKISKKWFASNNQPPLVKIPNVGLTIVKNYDQAMGPYAGFRDNLWGLFERFSKERKVRALNQSFISNGTMIDSLAHQAVSLQKIVTKIQEIQEQPGADGMLSPQIQFEMQREKIALDAMTLLFLENLQLKFAFYLPLREKIIVPGQDPDPETEYAKLVDLGIQGIMQNYNQYPPVLDQPTVAEKARYMLDNMVQILRDGIKISREEPPEPVTQTDSDSPEEFSAAVAEVLDQPCGCGEKEGGE